jgi:hypothetical protein
MRRTLLALGLVALAATTARAQLTDANFLSTCASCVLQRGANARQRSASQRGATCYNAAQRVATRRNVLQRVTTRRNVLQRSANAWQRSANAWQRSANAWQRSTAQCDTGTRRRRTTDRSDSYFRQRPLHPLLQPLFPIISDEYDYHRTIAVG